MPLRSANTRRPAPVHATRYPVVKSKGENGDRGLVMRAYNATVGATDGNIIAAIITTHTVMNQPKAPRSVQGPLSIPRIWSAVHHQPAIASTKSSATRSRCVRTAANVGARAPPRRVGSTAGAVTPSCRPGEVGLRESGLAFVLNAERVDARALGFGHRE